VYAQYRPYILVSVALFRLAYGVVHLHNFQEMEAALLGAGMEAEIFTVEGPAGIFAVYPNKGVNLGFTFLNEFVIVSYVPSVSIYGTHSWSTHSDARYTGLFHRLDPLGCVGSRQYFRGQ
jgi:hypothetical protein